MRRALHGVLALCLLTAAAGCSDEGDSADGASDGAAAGGEHDTPSVEAQNGSLEAIIAFSSTVDCLPSARFEKLLTEMAPTDGIGRPIQPFSPRITLPAGLSGGQPRLESENFSHDVTLPFDSDWHGLRLTGLSRWWTEESDHQGITLHFRDGAGEVVRALNRLGFELSPDGTRTVDGEVSLYLIVEAEDAGARSTCST